MNRRRFLSKTLGALGVVALAAIATTKRRPDRLELVEAEAARRGVPITYCPDLKGEMVIDGTFSSEETQHIHALGHMPRDERALDIAEALVNMDEFEKTGLHWWQRYEYEGAPYETRKAMEAAVVARGRALLEPVMRPA